jgi:hypothetical protein
MRRLYVWAALLLMLLPTSALAGMTATSDLDLEEVTGQTGMTVSMSVTVVASTIAWGDSDGFGTYVTAGWMILSSVTTPSVNMTNVTIDCGSDATNAFLQINLGTTNLIQGNLTIGSVVIGTASTSSTQSLGEVRMTSLGVKTGAILISGH